MSDAYSDAPAEGSGHYRPDLQEKPAQETVLGSLVANGYTSATAVPVALQPTQVRRPWRTTARTVFQALVALCVLFPVLVENTGLSVEDVPWLAIPLGVAAAVARIMADPRVEDFLRTFVPFLSAVPKEKTHG